MMSRKSKEQLAAIMRSHIVMCHTLLPADLRRPRNLTSLSGLVLTTRSSQVTNQRASCLSKQEMSTCDETMMRIVQFWDQLVTWCCCLHKNHQFIKHIKTCVFILKPTAHLVFKSNATSVYVSLLIVVGCLYWLIDCWMFSGQHLRQWGERDVQRRRER